MERNFYTDNFERLLKEKSDEFRMYPSRRVWHSIYNDLHPSRRWPSAAMSMVLLVVLIFIGYLNTSDNVSRKLAENDQATTGSERNNSANARNSSGSRNLTVSDQQGKDPASTNTTPGINTTDLTNSTALNSQADPVTNDPNTFTSSAQPEQESGNTASKTPPKVAVIMNANKNVVAEMNDYIQNGQLLTDIVARKNKVKSVTNADPSNKNRVEPYDGALTVSNDLVGITKANVPVPGSLPDEKKSADKDKAAAVKTGLALTDKIDPNLEKSWIEDYAFHNKSSRKKWKDRVTMEIYATPSVGYRRLSNTSNPEPVVTSLTAVPMVSKDVNSAVDHKPSLGLEAGVGFTYSFAKKFRLKAGIQLNYTNYGISTDQTNHPILTTLMFNDLNTGYSYLTPRTTSLSNTSGVKPVTLHNKTYQVSVPVGVAVKIAGNKNLEWYAGGSIQPTYVIGGKAYLVSSDYQNYVMESSLLRKWNLNTSVETYINYKMRGFNLQVGPQFRYQVMSTYNKKYTIKENLHNTGLKVGIVKNF
ncbi:MAG: outer membrane beta-barrel protein [Chitinophagaceae bacterium]|nr:outer membrane beta-barrel protein [Chitinophagaceae bacterium]